MVKTNDREYRRYNLYCYFNEYEDVISNRGNLFPVMFYACGKSNRMYILKNKEWNDCALHSAVRLSHNIRANNHIYPNIIRGVSTLFCTSPLLPSPSDQATNHGLFVTFHLTALLFSVNFTLVLNWKIIIMFL